MILELLDETFSLFASRDLYEHKKKRKSAEFDGRVNRSCLGC